MSEKWFQFSFTSWSAAFVLMPSVLLVPGEIKNKWIGKAEKGNHCMLLKLFMLFYVINLLILICGF